MDDMFFKAARIKLRFETSSGSLAVEDLFDLSLNSLDTVAKKVNKQLQDEGEVSFLPSTSRKPATHNNLRLEILRSIIAVRVQEQEDKKFRSENAARLATLKELVNNKVGEQLAAQSLEDLTKQIAELEAVV